MKHPEWTPRDGKRRRLFARSRRVEPDAAVPADRGQETVARAPRNAEPNKKISASSLSTGTPTPISRTRIAEQLSKRGYAFTFDDDGDITGLWDGHRFWFIQLGDHQEILQIRGRWTNPVQSNARLSALQAVNDWNRDRLWPKIYVRDDDEGTSIYAEVSVDFEYGATDQQLADTISCALVTSTQFFNSADLLLDSD